MIGATPWWRDEIEEDLWPVYEDFKVFLYAVWDHLGLPEPTPAQYRIADRLQYGRDGVDVSPSIGRADIIMAFRGVGKSYITAAFCLWRLLRDPRNEKILVVSASSGKAKEFVAQVKGILDTMPLLVHLRPTDGQRNQADRFDVAGASLAQSTSLRAGSITGQITGARATLIVADDIEVKDNSKTVEARATILASVNEFDAIKVPAQYDPDTGEVTVPAGDTVFLGTPQSLESVYMALMKERGFDCLCIPARYPRADKLVTYTVRRDDGTEMDILDPYLAAKLDADPELEWQPTDPKRFTEEDLRNRESRGRSWFMLQYMLDTSLTDAERYPLKLNDLIVMAVNRTKAPITVQWGRESQGRNTINDIPLQGFAGDGYLRPLFVDDEWRAYESSVLFVDPSGRGVDETAWCVIKVLGGTFFVTILDAHIGPVNEAYEKIARCAADQQVNVIEIEPNFAPGVWINGFYPTLQRIWPGGEKVVSRQYSKEAGKHVNIELSSGAGCLVQESEWAKGRKEERIIDTLEPVTNTHRLVIDEDLVRRNSEMQDVDYSLMYQFTHITRDPGSLRKDDRLDCLAGAVAYHQKALVMDNALAGAGIIEQELDDMLAEFIDNCTAPVGDRRGMNRTGRYQEGGIKITL